MKIFLGVLLIAGAAAGFVQNRRIAELKDEITAKKESRADANNSQPGTVKSNFVTATQITEMRTDRAELMRLRASLPDLRIAAQSPEEIGAEIQRLKQSAQQDDQKAHLIHADFEAVKYSRAAQMALENISVLLQRIQRSKGGALPRSFEDVGEALKSGELQTGFGALWENLAEGKPPLNISRNDFEFVPEGASNNAIFLVRERQPRQLPDGTWARLYLTSDFSVNELKLPDGNFAAWESAQGR